jgi:hypothetical protein
MDHVVEVVSISRGAEYATKLLLAWLKDEEKYVRS